MDRKSFLRWIGFGVLAIPASKYLPKDDAGFYLTEKPSIKKVEEKYSSAVSGVSMSWPEGAFLSGENTISGNLADLKCLGE